MSSYQIYIDVGIVGTVLICSVSIPCCLVVCCVLLVVFYLLYNFRSSHWTGNCFQCVVDCNFSAPIDYLFCTNLNRKIAIFAPSCLLCCWFCVIPVLLLVTFLFLIVIKFGLLPMPFGLNIVTLSCVFFVTFLSSIPIYVSLSNSRIYRRLSSCILIPFLTCFCCDFEPKKIYHICFIENFCSMFSMMYMFRNCYLLCWSWFFLIFAIFYILLPFTGTRFSESVEVLFSQGFLLLILSGSILICICLKCFLSFEKEFSDVELEKTIKELLHDHSGIAFSARRLKLLINALYDEKVEVHRVLESILKLSLLSDESFGVTMFHKNKNIRPISFASEHGENIVYNNLDIKKFIAFKLLKEQEIPYRYITDCRLISQVIVTERNKKNNEILVSVKIGGEEWRKLRITVADVKDFYSVPFEMAYFRRIVDNCYIPEYITGEENMNIYGVERILKGNLVKKNFLEFDSVEIEKHVEIRFWKHTLEGKRQVAIVIVNDDTIGKNNVWTIWRDYDRGIFQCFMDFFEGVWENFRNNYLYDLYYKNIDEEKIPLKADICLKGDKDKDSSSSSRGSASSVKSSKKSSSSSDSGNNSGNNSDDVVGEEDVNLEDNESGEEDVISDSDGENEGGDSESENKSSSMSSGEENDSEDKKQNLSDSSDAEDSNTSNGDSEKKEKSKKKENDEIKEIKELDGIVRFLIRPEYFKVDYEDILFQFEHRSGKISRKKGDEVIPEYLRLGSTDMAISSPIEEVLDEMYLIKVPQNPSKEKLKMKKLSNQEKLGIQLVHFAPIQMTTQDFLKKRRRYLSARQKRREEVLEDQRYMKNLLKVHGFELTGGSVGAGNCQFSSVRDQLILLGRSEYKNQSKKALGIRNEVCKWLVKNKETFGMIIEAVEGSFDKYIKEMKMDGNYGDDFTLSAMSEMYDVNITRITTQGLNNSGYVEDMILITPQSGKAEETIYVAHYVAWEHYESIKKVGKSNSSSSSD